MPTPHPRPWHRGSEFGTGRRHPLTRDQRARYKFLLNAHTRAHRLTDKGEKVGLALLKRLGADGRCDPSQATLGADAGCDERTVRRANDRLRDLGLLTWQQRLVRDGWRTAQTSNAYVLVPSLAAPAPPSARGGHSVRQTQSLDKSRDFLTAAPRSDAEMAAAQAALARRRGVIEGRLLGKG